MGDFVVNNQELIKEWDWEKNERLKLFPDKLTMGSQKKTWWKCQKGHNWLSSISNRTKGNKCPVCSNKKVLKGYNDLATTHPNLVEEWNYYRNENIAIDSVSSGSGRKVWWKCEKGHEWEAVISSRTTGTGCPYCSNKKVLQGYNDLLTKFPTLASEWDYEKNGDLKPHNLVYGSNKKVWWKCSVCSHSWGAQVVARTLYKTECPECEVDLKKRRNALKSIPNEGESLEELYPDLMEEWAYDLNNVSPSQLKRASKRKVWWQCKKGHEWKAAIYSRVSGNGCPICSGNQLLEGYNDLLTLYPIVAEEWNYNRNGELRPQSVHANARKKVWWKCKQGHEYEAAIYHRTGKKATGCPVCANRQLLFGFNDLATQYPDLAEEWNYERNVLEPSEILSGTAKKVWWKCKKGHEWESLISSRCTGVGCPYCAGKKVLKGYNDLATVFPDIAQEWDYESNNGLLPSNISAGSNKEAAWICSKCGYKYRKRVHQKVKYPKCGKCKL